MTRLQFLQSFIAATFASSTATSAKLANQRLPTIEVPSTRTDLCSDLDTHLSSDLSMQESLPDWLVAWQADDIIPITDADDDRMLIKLLSHQQTQQPLEILYHGGTWDSREPRNITPFYSLKKPITPTPNSSPGATNVKPP